MNKGWDDVEPMLSARRESIGTGRSSVRPESRMTEMSAKKISQEEVKQYGKDLQANLFKSIQPKPQLELDSDDENYMQTPTKGNRYEESKTIPGGATPAKDYMIKLQNLKNQANTDEKREVYQAMEKLAQLDLYDYEKQLPLAMLFRKNEDRLIEVVTGGKLTAEEYYDL